MLKNKKEELKKPYIMILGSAQDGGYPQAGCLKQCCMKVKRKPYLGRMVTSIAIVDNVENKCWIIDMSPDFPKQLHMINDITNSKSPVNIAGIFLTHAHIGHYSGLLHLGREALGSKDIPVYVMPKMYSFLENNAPWSQLVNLKNIQLNPLQNNKYVEPLKNLKITPILVPHRDEFSETVGYKIKGPNKTILFIPDIDKWTLWEENLITLLKEVDIAFIDATFFSQEEVNYRPLSEIPHPLVVETIAYLKNEDISLKNKVYFIHMNHTNPMLDENSKVSKLIFNEGFNIARLGYQFEL